MTRRPSVAVWKFASCDGCQLSLLDCEDELLLEAGAARVQDTYDVSLVEGSITTQHDAERIREIRAASGTLVAIGACATSGGIQALRNFADVRGFLDAVYAHPHYIATLETSTPIVHHVRVDVELRGCPIDRGQLLEVVAAVLAGRAPNLPTHSVCVDCKRRGNPCVMVASGIPCLGPLTQAGCGALCPAYHRGCYGCFGPSEQPNVPALTAHLRELGVSDPDLVRLFRSFNAEAEAFKSGAEAVLKGVPVEVRA